MRSSARCGACGPAGGAPPRGETRAAGASAPSRPVEGLGGAYPVHPVVSQDRISPQSAGPDRAAPGYAGPAPAAWVPPLRRGGGAADLPKEHDKDADMTDTAAAAVAKLGDLRVTLATYLYLVREAGHAIVDPTLAEACAAVSAAGATEAAAAGAALVDAIALAPDADPAAVQAFLDGAFGAGKVGALPMPTGAATGREARARALRSYQFRTSLPLIAQIVDRFPDGHVGAHWVMVERVTDQVTLMDPYPWDDVDEEVSVDLIEFLVKWELAGTVSFAFVG